MKISANRKISTLKCGTHHSQTVGSNLKTDIMKDKRPIDKIRDSGGHADIGTEEDGAIIEMKNIGDRLLIIKERAIYEMVFADSIDPERTNINLPPTIHKLIIDKGTESEVVSRILLTAKTIFKSEYFPDNINCDKILGLTIDLLSEISLLEKEIDEYITKELKVSNKYEKRKEQKGSYELPSIVNLESVCKTIFQKADHIEQTLMEIITQFYADKGLTKQSHFPKFHEVLISMYGEEDGFVKFISNTVYFMQVTRQLRNGLDHRLKTVTVKDFEIQKDGNIFSPTIELNYKEVKLERISLNELLKITKTNLIDIIETTFAYLAGYNVKTEGMPYQMREIPEEKRRNNFVKYSFWMPIGEGGFYCQ